MFDDVPRGVRYRQGGLQAQSMPLTAWVSEENMLKSGRLAFDKRRVLLGAIGGKLDRVTNVDGGDESHVQGGKLIGIGDDRHIATVAGSRSGKGVSSIVPTLLSYAGSVLAIDPKGDLASITARYREDQLKHDVFVLDPFCVTRGRAARRLASFNPLSILEANSQTLKEDAGLIADAIVVAEGSEPHWDQSARNFLEGLIIHVTTWPEFEGRRDLVTVYDLAFGRAELDGSIGMDPLRAQMDTNDAADGAVQNSAADFFEKSEGERDGVLSTLRRHLRFLSYDAIRENLSGHDVDLADLKRKKVTIFLCLPAMRMGTCNRWLRIFVNLALLAFESEPSKPKVPVLLVLDEFATLGHMKAIEDAAGQIAGFGVKLWTILQDLGQLEALYQKRWQTFLGNAGVLHFFGNNDAFTLEWIEKRLGTTTLQVPSTGEVGDRQQLQTDMRGRSWSLQTQPLMTLEEISRFFGRDDPQARSLVINAGYPPMMVQRIRYYSHKAFAGRFDDV